MDYFGFYRLDEILKIIPVSKSYWWDQVRAQNYPQPIKLGPKITVWKKEDIRKLVDELSKKTIKYQ